jgi:molybdopterin-binding protein
MKISARNVFKGTVKAIRPGFVNTEVTLELPGGTEIVSAITKSSAERLGLAIGKSASAVIKSNEVLVMVD